MGFALVSVPDVDVTAGQPRCGGSVDYGVGAPIVVIFRLGGSQGRLAL